MIEQVEDFRTKLKSFALCQGNILVQGKIDFAIFNMKDLPLLRSDSMLVIAATPERSSPYEALVSGNGQDLKSLKPVRHQVARTSYKVPLPPAYGPPVTHVDEPVRTDKIAYGGYLAGPVGHCVLCHTPPAADGPFDMSRAYQGGRELPDLGNPGAETVSRNITAGSEHGIGDWKDAQIKRAIMSGIRADGTRLARTMPFDWYARMTPADLDAIVAYLRSLPQEKM